MIKLLANLRKEYNLASMETVVYAEGDILVVKRIGVDVELTLCVNMTENEACFADKSVKAFSYDLSIDRRK